MMTCHDKESRLPSSIILETYLLAMSNRASVQKRKQLFAQTRNGADEEEKELGHRKADGLLTGAH
jgi:hypothetical protein